MEQSGHRQTTSQRDTRHHQRRHESRYETPAVRGWGRHLEVKPGVQSVDLPEFPVGYKQEALASREALNLLRKEPSLEGGHAYDLH